MAMVMVGVVGEYKYINTDYLYEKGDHGSYYPEIVDLIKRSKNGKLYYILMTEIITADYESVIVKAKHEFKDNYKQEHIDIFKTNYKNYFHYNCQQQIKTKI